MKTFHRFLLIISLQFIIANCFVDQTIKAQVKNSPVIGGDECAAAINIPALPDSFFHDTRLATPNPADPALSCASGGGGKTVWYRYTAASSGWVTFTTRGSLPSTYDVAMGIFTGSCGSLTMVDCNDDISPGIVRQSEITRQVTAGTTYTILIGEWNGGGPDGGVPTGGDLQFRIFRSGPPVIVRGPKSGSVPNGAVATTDAKVMASLNPPSEPETIENELEVPLLPAPKDVMRPKGLPGSNYIEQRVMQSINESMPLLVNGFEAFSPTGVIPPDPILAVGPNHLIAVVNSRFRIFDKQGTLLKDFDLNSWFSSVVSPVGASDPQVVYDHYAHRWVMTLGSYNPPYKLLLSVSDDENPLGTWYNWAMPAGLGDSLTGALPDYPQLGYDEKAIYLTTREYNPAFSGSRLRIIPKTQLYSNTAGPVTWTDFWDFRDPDHPSVPLDGIRPSKMYGAPGVHFLVNASPYYPGTFITLWTITNPATAPAITGMNIPVVQYTAASNPNQLGGGTLIEGGGSAIRSNPVYRDSSLYLVHPVASGTGDAYSAIHYIRINPFTKQNIEDVAMGLDGYWHFYPALMVNADHDIMMTYTRSGLNEYPGAYLSGHKATDPPSLSSSVPMRIGDGHYELVGGGRNRWGDYMGTGLDPADTNSVWVHSEYSMQNNQWGTWVGQITLRPFAGKYISASPGFMNFGSDIEGPIGDTLKTTVRNYGLDSLTISAITLPDSNFTLVNYPALPVKLGTYDSIVVSVSFTPRTGGRLYGSVVIASNDAQRSPFQINLEGENLQTLGVVHPNGGEIWISNSTHVISWTSMYVTNVRIDYTTDNGVIWSNIVTTKPATPGWHIWKVPATPSSHCKVRVSNAVFGTPSDESEETFSIPMQLTAQVKKGWNIISVPLQVSDSIKSHLYPSAISNAFGYESHYLVKDTLVPGLGYWLKFSTPDSAGFIGTPVEPETLNIHDGWNLIGSITKPLSVSTIESDPSGITCSDFFGYNVGYYAADTIYPGSGYWIKTNQMGKLIFAGNRSTSLFAKNRIKIVSTVELPPQPPYSSTSVDEIPKLYALENAYPNPFNPSTIINYQLPSDNWVTLKVYNLLGEEVTTVVNEFQVAGFKSVAFDASASGGLPSGVYYYRLVAKAIPSGQSGNFIETKKLILMK